MIRKIKKGFTLVELVVVIAVIAILAAVSVVSYVGITKKAKESNDKMVIDQFNTVLTNTLTLKKKGSVHELLENLKEDAGFDIRTFAPELQGTSFVYFNKDNEESFAYWDKTKQEVTYPKDLEGTKKSTNLWFFDDAVVNSGSVTFDDGASHYLKSLSGATGATVVSVENGGGVDVGNQEVTVINIINEGAKASGHIVARTNGGTLNINAPLDTLDHYDDGEVLDITAIAGASYHEYGNFPKASIGQGRIVVEDSGEIPAVVITSPTNSVKVETSKDIVVSASPEVVAQLGSDKLENVEVKVTSAQASVVVDEKIKTDNVDAAGKSASDIVSITKVKDYAELSAAISQETQAKYIMFTDDITAGNYLNIKYSTTIDGNGFKLNGGGNRTSKYKTVVALNQNDSSFDGKMTDVTIRNLTIENTTASSRLIETRGKINSLTIENCDLLGASTTANGEYPQLLTIGGSQATQAKVLIKNSTFEASHYSIITFNPVDMLVEGSTFTSYAALYMKGKVGSAGSRGSTVEFNDSKLICQNYSSNSSSDFGAIVFEDGSINVNVKNSTIDVTEHGTCNQSAVVFSSSWAAYYGTDLKEVNVTFKNVNIKGGINDEQIEYDSTNVVIIQSGATTNDPTPYLADGSFVTNDGLFYSIQERPFQNS